MSKFQEFQDVIHEIFEIDKSELDFGIYRILNQKSKEIQKFINEDLKPQVEEAFSKIDKENREGQENEVFSALSNFFKRYYEAGDFISKRRYNQDKYAIPYNGEEVKLYWANYDQYYIKTTENLSNFAFYLPSGKKVNFQILEASVSKDNNKTSADKERIFVLHKTEKLRTEGNEIFIPFEYALVDKKEKGKDSAKTLASQILKSKEAKDFDSGLSQPFPTDKNKDRTLLEKRIEEFTARYNFDYFIHKNLGGFLRRELDFFIKNEILYLEDLEEQDPKSVQSQITKVKTIKSIGEKIIAFLEQVENFQKKLWLKKKFITETNYCITLDRIPKTLYPQILENKEQLAEWERLFSISERKGYTKQLKLEFLENNQNLVLDTKFFSDEFKQNLLASIPNFDESCNGLLIHSENFQALNLLQKRYQESLDAVYIDPPYNTSASEIIYKNSYLHSSWNTLILNRISISKRFLTNSGIFTVAIDDFEYSNLKNILDNSFTKIIGVAVVRSNPVGRKTTGRLTPTHEYVIFCGASENSIPSFLEKDISANKRYPYEDEKGRYTWLSFIRTGNNDRREDSPKMFYPIIVTKDNDLRIPKMSWSTSEKEFVIEEIIDKTEIIVLPIKKEGNQIIEKNWQRGYERFSQEKEEYRVRRMEDGIKIDFKARMDEEALPKTWWDSNRYASSNYGALELKNLFGQSPFSFPKSIYLVTDSIVISGLKRENSVVLDYFAGSGTTGHAVINLNREDGGDRKYILVEMGEYFETVLKPRIQKVVYASQWKEGKPQELGVYIEKLKKEKAELNKELNNLMGFQSQEEYEFQQQRLSGEIARVEEQISRVEEELKTENSFGSISHCFKYIRLESYEDTLNNLEVEEKLGALDFSSRGDKEEIMLKYVLDLETKDSQSLLNLDGFANPFSYSMQILENGALKKKNMDLVETFHYLLGVVVTRYHAREEVKNDKVSFLVQCVEGELRTGESVLIVWRTIPSELGVANKELKVHLESKFKLKDFDKLYINGDSILEKAELIEAHFHKAMFDGKDV
ncbi:site-specific DNA-methyltransferase [Leptospira paudalimensis]|uniref:DNA methylase N-4/N-6 domain-containing protein n=1 Tax=Leptospira paudalimensis TaxID=2950024 RepID=A0ABT3MCK2_9LEPT|nr:DNA methyltransferase [Leptospira paudalimensis]MCW7506121.1 hypothetical protein [Leptospira paudalimensis]